METARLRSNWVFGYGVISGYLVLNTVLMRYTPDFPQKFRLMAPFDLSVEMNLAVWWSGMGLFLAALLFYQRYSLKPASDRIAWLFLAGVALALAVDELGSLHERVDLFVGESGLIPFGLVLCALLAAAFRVLGRTPAGRRSAVPLGMAFFLFGTVVLQEKLEHALQWPVWAEGLRVGVEESTELFATLLLLRVGAGQLEPFHPWAGLRRLLPDPFRFRHLHLLLWTGFALHLLGSVLLVPYIQDHRGDPTLVYPAFVFFLLFALAGWKALDPAAPARLWKTAAILFLACSANEIYPLYMFIPHISRVVGREVFLSTDLQILLLAVLITGMFWKREEGLAGRYKALLIAYGGILVAWQTDTLWGVPLAPVKIGLFAPLLFTAVLEGTPHAVQSGAAIKAA